MTALELQTSIREAFLKYFPNGYISCSELAFGSTGAFWFCGLVSDINDVSSKIRMNDHLQITFSISDNFVKDSNTEIDNKLVVEFSRASISTLPIHAYCAMHHDKIAVRKINNTPQKVLIQLDKYFMKARDQIKVHISNNNLYYQDRIPSKYLDL